MDFRILGPLEVIENGEPLDLGTFKQRSLLALLLINANRVVSTDRILEELWGDEAAGKQNALWVYVSRLRSVLEPARSDSHESTVLVTRDHGYSLLVDSERVDAAQFEARVAEGRASLKAEPEAAGTLLREALDQWRGSALEDFTYEEFAQTEIARLEELRVGATEDRFEADLRSGKAGELVGDLETLRAQNPLREGPVRQLMLALYWSGRQADALRMFEGFRSLMGEELGIEPSPELASLEEQMLLHDERVRPPAAVGRLEASSARLETPNPFKGLRAFAEADAEIFFGRDRIVAEALRKIAADERLIALVGPSGSGKSSVAHAGLIPALRKGAILGSDAWLIADMVPGAFPFAEVEAALLRSTIDPPDSLAEQLGSDQDGLLRAVLRVLPNSSSRLVLVIDQFEELFVLTEEESERHRFLDNLVLALDDPHGRLIVALTLRADFYDRPLDHPDFGARLGAGVVNVVPMAADELETAAQAPATVSGVTLSPALTAQLLSDVLGEPGALPLFQYALTEMFDRRTADHLDLSSYESLGGVRGALGRRAEDLYQRLAEEEQAAAKQLFLRLVTISESDEWNRRRVRASELVALDIDIVAIQSVIEAFGSHRLLTLDRDNVSGAPTVEVAHEALLKEWDRLREWIEDSRTDIQRHAAVSAATREWVAAERAADYLYGGSRLADFELWAAHTEMKLAPVVQDFLEAAVEQRILEESEQDARSVSEAQLRRRAKTRLVATILSVAALAMSVLALWLVTRTPGPAQIVHLAADGSLLGGVQEGFARSIDDFGVRVEEVLIPEYPEQLEEIVRQVSEEGRQLVVIPTGYQAEEAVHAVASGSPDTHYVVVDVWPGFRTGAPPEGLPNVTYMVFAEHEGAYLVGAAAALKSETGTVGFVGFSEEIEFFEAGFVAGARSVRPDIDVNIVYLTEFGGEAISNPAHSKAAATDMYRAGADVIYTVSGPSPFANQGVFDAASVESDKLGRQLWAIGSDTDEFVEVNRVFPNNFSPPNLDHKPLQWREHLLTSSIKPFGDAVYQALEAWDQGDLSPGLQIVGSDYSTSGGFIDDVVPRLEAIKEQIRSGEIVVPFIPER